MTRFALSLAWILVLLLLVLIGIVVTSARAQVQGKPDVLVFHRYQGRSIVTMLLDIPTRLEHPAPDFLTLLDIPETSPDGRWIAFTQLNYTTLNGDIFLRSTDGSTQVRLINHALDDHSPAWSPDGGRIAFTSNRDGNYEIYLVQIIGDGTAGQSTAGQITGGHIQRLTVNPALDISPVWWVNAR